MSDGPPTVGHTDLKLRDRALVVCDVDEVVLDFIAPFDNFLQANGHQLLPRSFRLTGNVVALDDETREASSSAVNDLLEGFFAAQDTWQTPTHKASSALANVAEIADVVFLTAMPPRHFDVRRALLDMHGMTYPLVATEDDKGPLIRQIHAERAHPLFFIDDMAYNLKSVKHHAPHTHTIHFMSNVHFRSMAPHPGDDVAQARDWDEIEQIIFDSINA